AWERGQELVVHGWIYGLTDGLLRDLNVGIAGQDELLTVYQEALSTLHTIDAQP
ncbi:MAG: carbonic anhydrase, partial [Acidobacteria bacterium]|nr:carbonic anhydrase [Acidobacteriota bacterium]